MLESHSAQNANSPERASYHWCRQLCQSSNSSFFRSFALLDRPRRQAIYALYAFARITDDLGDSSDPPEVRTARLAGWHSLLSEHLQVDSPGADVAHPVRNVGSARDSLCQYSGLWPALADSVDRFHIPPRLLEDIITGVMMDIDHQTPASWDELKAYCYYVASSVGLACTYIWRAGDELPTQHATDCGIAFQLTNILRDVAEDARMGRIYVPQSELKKFDVDPRNWLAGAPGGRWQELIVHVAGEAYALYDRGWATIDFLTPRSQRMFSLMYRSYRSLLDQVVAAKNDLWTGPKICLPVGSKLSLLATHFVPPLYARLPAP